MTADDCHHWVGTSSHFNQHYNSNESSLDIILYPKPEEIVLFI